MNLWARISNQKAALALPGVRQGLALVLATTLAFGLDYLFNLTTGRLLDQAEFGVFVALTGIGQVLVVASRVIQTVVTRYIAQFQNTTNGSNRAASFFRAMYRRAWFWGSIALVIMLLASRPLANFLQIGELGPLIALALATLLLVVRPVVGGTLQGKQQFAALGGVQLVQAAFRLGVGTVLMLAGLGTLGAMSALPLSSLVALAYGLFALDKSIWRSGEAHHGISLAGIYQFSTYTAAGLIGYALLANMDAILIKRFFDPVAAGNYAAAITLGKVIQFFPLAIIMILFPKAAQRKASRRDTADLLLPAMLLVSLICGGVALTYVLFTDFVVRVTLGAAYQVDSLLLGLVGLAMLLSALTNVWLNYFLSTDYPFYVYLILAGNLLQVAMMTLFHRELWHLPAIMAFNSAWLVLAGGALFLRQRRADLVIKSGS